MSKEEEAKLLYGMLFSLKSFSAKLSPVDMKQGFTSYKTNVYRLSLYETPSSLKFVLNTDNEASQQEVRSALKFSQYSEKALTVVDSSYHLHVKIIEYCLDPRAAVGAVLPGVRGVREQVPDVGAGRDHHQQPLPDQAGPVHAGIQHLQAVVSVFVNMIRYL